MTLSDTVLIVAGLLVVISVVQPLARLLNLPNTVLLAVVGVLIGLTSTYLVGYGQARGFNSLSELMLGVPITSAGFLYIFVPALLFQAALDIDVRRMVDDAAPIFVLAVVAVVVATGVIGLSVWSVSGVSVVACLLVGAIVATTDPAAVVVAIFRDLGAPSRLTRLVEGESLLNDATAIVLFTVLLGILTTGIEPTFSDAARMFIVSLVGGAGFGFIVAWLAMAALPLVRGSTAAELTLSIAIPYLLFVICVRFLDVSGVVAVVVGGLVVGTVGRNRLSAQSWQFLSEVWEQLAFLAGSLVFVLAAILVPRLLVGITGFDILLIGVVVVAALVARAVVLFGLLPVLTALKLGERISAPFKFVILWGGLRGAVTLALALAITENPAVPVDIQRFVAILATGFVLFSLLVGGTTLRPLIRLMQIDRLSPLDQALRSQILSLAQDTVRESVEQVAKRYGISAASPQQAPGGRRGRGEEADGIEAALEAIPDRDRVTIGLVALVSRERAVVAQHAAAGAISPSIAERLLAGCEQMADATRSQGRLGYSRSGQRRLRYPPSFKMAHLLHRRLGIDTALERRVADRFETLLVSRIVSEDLGRYTRGKLGRVLGKRLSGILGEILAIRVEAMTAALDALRLTYPEYAEAMEQRFLGQLAVRLESAEYDLLHEEGLIGAELLGSLKRELQTVRAATARRPRLDLGLDTARLIDRLPMLAQLGEADRRQIETLLKPRLAVPGEPLIRKGERGTSMFFISSGAVEVATGRLKVRLGRGDFFGEMALMARGRRQADVTALAYCQLLVLEESDFRTVVASNPAVREHFDRIAAERRRMNAADVEEAADSE